MAGLLLVGAVFLVYALTSGVLEKASISAPMVFVLAGFLLGPSVLDLLHINLNEHAVRLLTELTLGILLFADAATLRVHDVRADPMLARRLLTVGLPLTIVAGAVAAYAIAPRMGWAGAAMVASMLAATDTALVIAVVSLPVVPTRIRRAINIESGLNDGICAPFFTVLLAATLSEEGVKGGSWVAHAAGELGLAVVAGVVVGAVGGIALTAARRRGWSSGLSEELAALTLALLAYGVSVAIGGSGFVAAFVGGMAFGATTPEGERRAVRFVEDFALLSSYAVWTIFGALFVGPVLTGSIMGAAIAYALVSLTFVRMIPVGIAMLRTRLHVATVAFIGWFGPRGLASVVFALIALESLHEAPIERNLVLQVATWTILLSVVLQGLTSRPLSKRYGRLMTTWGPGAPEAQEVAEAPMRRRTL